MVAVKSLFFYLVVWIMRNVPCPLNGVWFHWIGIDGANHFSVISRIDHDVAGDVSYAEIGKRQDRLELLRGIQLV